MNRCPAAGLASSRLPPRAAGFTLVEVVVALAVLSLLMLSTLAALRTFGNTRGSLDVLTERTERLRTVSSFLRDSLEASITRPGGGGLQFGGVQEEPAYFQGGVACFQWKARLLIGEAYGGTFLVRVAREGRSLVFRWQSPPEDIASATWEGRSSRVLVQDIDEFSLAYRNSLDGEWRATWQEADSPDAVRIVIRSAARYWPELVMAVPR